MKLLFSFLLMLGCIPFSHAQHQVKRQYGLDTLIWIDTARNRTIPVAIYQPVLKGHQNWKGLVIFSHGYGANKGGDYLAYSYLTTALAAKGYLVISIQHELATDDLIPTQGIPQVVRKPFWERGTDNIHFVIRHWQQAHPSLKNLPVTLIGHSNGGDMTALFPQRYPGITSQIITLDNRRMALPRTLQPRVFSLRSSDQPADPGVIPTAEEQAEFHTTIISLKDINHGDMDDKGSSSQHHTILTHLFHFLAEK